MAERLAGAGGSVRFSEYVVAGGDTVAVRNSGSDGSVRLRWQHKDHLGSVVALTDETGAVAERLSFDAWGKRRNPNGSDDPAGALTSQATRGFTGHEMLDDVDLVHMNGRVYDPITARFTSADPRVDRKFGSQGWNRYAYVGNNPLTNIDPSGYSWVSNTVGRMLGPVAGLSFIPAVHRVEQRVFSNQIAASALMASSVFCGPYAAACAAANAAYLSSLHGGGLMDMGKAAAIAYVTAAAFQGVGALSAADGPLAGAGIGSDGLYAANVAGSAMVGCASTAAGGGSCGSGALSAGFGAAAAPAIAGLPKEWRLVSAMIAGGTGSVLGGGKFGNGATTAAFQYLFNQMASEARQAQSGVSAGEQLAEQRFSGEATYYNLPGNNTASGAPFDPNADAAAMYQKGVRLGDQVRVELQSDPSRSVDVIVNDTGPFARGSDGRALRPLQADPRTIIDLTPHAFKELTGDLRQGRVPVTVIKP